MKIQQHSIIQHQQMDHKEIQFHMTTIENTEMLLQSIYKNRMVIMIIIN